MEVACSRDMPCCIYLIGAYYHVRRAVREACDVDALFALASRWRKSTVE